jgi:hypothetical protein
MLPTIETTEYDLPTHWAVAILNGDLAGLDSDDLEALRLFTAEMVQDYGQCWAIDVKEDGSGFMSMHDARVYDVLPCDCSTFIFDITKR